VAGTIRDFVFRRRVKHQAAIARVKRASKMMADCALAMIHSSGLIVHAFSELFKTKQSSLNASLGEKWPRARTAGAAWRSGLNCVRGVHDPAHLAGKA
jgi:hypothetical protein